MKHEQKVLIENRPDALNQHICEVLTGLELSDGICLFIGTESTAIIEELSQTGLSLIYISVNDLNNESTYLKSKGIEAYSFQLTRASEIASFINEILGSRKLSAVSMIDILGILPKSEDFVKYLHELVVAHNAQLIVSALNITHKAIVFGLMEGESEYLENLSKEHRLASFISHNHLEHIMQSSGFKQKRNFDFSEETPKQHAQSDSIFQSSSTTIHQYLSWVKKIADPYADTRQFLRVYTPIASTPPTPLNKSEHRPFLTVVTRTQGKRLLALQEILLCLSTQSNTDFEVLLIGHRLATEAQAAIEQCIQDLPDWFRQHIRFIEVNDGNRTKPLHVGFMEARGEYVVILDDDDLVFDNWVEVFYDLAKSNPGTVLRAYSVNQEWKRLIINGDEALQATNAPQPLYCHDFDFIRQLYINGCPSMSYAIPSYVYQKLGIHFNLDLSTTEDWDFLMRSVFLCGLSEARETTSIYRLWENIDASHQTHNQFEWEQNQARVIDRMNKMPIVFPPGSVQKIINTHAKSLTYFDELKPLLYIDEGDGFSEELSLEDDGRIGNPYIRYFTIEPDNWIHSIRIDPGEKGMIMLSNLTIDIVELSGKNLEIDTDTIFINGRKTSSGLLFVESDPQIIIEFPSKMKLSEVRVSYYASVPCADDLIEFGILLPTSKSVYMMIRRLREALKKHGLKKTIKMITTLTGRRTTSK